MRRWVVDRLENYPKRYNPYRKVRHFKKHCEAMGKPGFPGTDIELLAAADIFFMKIEVNSGTKFEPRRERSKTKISLIKIGDNYTAVH
jgi:hypothetical protein